MTAPAAINYETLIDAQTWAFIRKTLEHAASIGPESGLAEQRAQYTALDKIFGKGRPAGVIVSDHIIGSVPVRVYETATVNGCVLFAHGGGFVLGNLDSHDSICADICASSGCQVIAVDYRLSPEHKHPAAYADVLSVAEHLCLQNSLPLVVAGDSAGATLVASVTHAMRERIAGQVLIYPYLGGDMERGSYQTHARAPLLTRQDMEYYARVRCAGALPVGDVRFAPLQDTDFAGLPPSVIFTAECDPLCDDGYQYSDKVTDAGGKSTLYCEKGLPHGYLRARHSVDRAKLSFARMTDAVKMLTVTSV